MSRYVEIGFLVIIAVLVAVGGRLLLATFSAHRPIAAVVLLALIAVSLFALRRTYKTPGEGARLVITKYVTYLVAAGLALADTLAPVKWLPGSCIAAVEVALVFDMITIATRERAGA
ncbi:MAG: hypothetical protein NVS2B17_00090 [Candidatus Velthaea sp.]